METQEPVPLEQATREELWEIARKNDVPRFWELSKPKLVQVLKDRGERHVRAQRFSTPGFRESPG